MGFGWTEASSHPSPPITYNGSTTFNYRLVGQKNIVSTYQKITNKLLSDRKILTINNHHIWRLIKTLNRHQVYQSQIYQNQSTLHPKIIPSALMTPIWDNMIEIYANTTTKSRTPTRSIHIYTINH
ncbi:hypothetical protein RhiirA4_475600 [Rhizophagus irregularis]|uniref:Uncharacterized protein n=1 Tax=Rhizophagus irregularis TaxID=588596 RepID=A0A2I1HAE5_9GLOM|nr:hypothetical protein RhiirA4_475600 [Rhizophagus irregularis]